MQSLIQVALLPVLAFAQLGISAEEPLRNILIATESQSMTLEVWNTSTGTDLENQAFKLNGKVTATYTRTEKDVVDIGFCMPMPAPELEPLIKLEWDEAAGAQEENKTAIGFTDDFTVVDTIDTSASVEQAKVDAATAKSAVDPLVEKSKTSTEAATEAEKSLKTAKDAVAAAELQASADPSSANTQALEAAKLAETNAQSAKTAADKLAASDKALADAAEAKATAAATSAEAAAAGAVFAGIAIPETASSSEWLPYGSNMFDCVSLTAGATTLVDHVVAEAKLSSIEDYPVDEASQSWEGIEPINEACTDNGDGTFKCTMMFSFARDFQVEDAEEDGSITPMDWSPTSVQAFMRTSNSETKRVTRVKGWPISAWLISDQVEILEEHMPHLADWSIFFIFGAFYLFYFVIGKGIDWIKQRAVKENMDQDR